MGSSLFIVMPVYNEQDALPLVLDQWYPIIMLNPSNRMLVLNDGSKDQTMNIIRDYAKDHPQVIGIDKENSGHGATIYEGYKLALTMGADFVFQTDSDGQTSPDEFPDFWKLIQDPSCSYDAILGYRNARKDGISRIIVTKTLKQVVKMTMKADVKDANVPYRLMRADSLRKALEYVPENHNLTNVVLSAAFDRLGMNVRFLPISFAQRQTGVNSVNLPKICKIGIEALYDFSDISKKLP